MPHPQSKKGRSQRNANVGWLQQATLALWAPAQLPWLAQPKEAYLPAKKKEKSQEAKVVHKERRNSLAAAMRSRGGAPERPKPEVKDAEPKMVPSLALDVLPGKACKTEQGAAKPRGDAKRGDTKNQASAPASPPRSSTSTSETLSFSPLGSENWTTTGAAIVDGFAQMSEFLRRGSSVASPARSEPTMVEATALQKRLDDWAAEVGFARPRLTCEPREAPRSQEDLSHLIEIKLLVHGVEVSVQMANSAHAPLVIASATTECRWAFIARGVMEAATEAKGEALEVFLDTLLEVWELPTGRATAPGPAPGTPQEELVDDSEDSGDDYDERRQEEEKDLAEQEDSAGFRGSFEEWLAERPPLFRFDQAAKGRAWDYPPSRSEKKELLLLQLFAEEGERQEQIAALQAKVPESPAARGGRAHR